MDERRVAERRVESISIVGETKRWWPDRRQSDLSGAINREPSPGHTLAQDAASSLPADPEALRLAQKLENYYDFQCEGGALKNCTDWTAFKRAYLEALERIRALESSLAEERRNVVWAEQVALTHQDKREQAAADLAAARKDQERLDALQAMTSYGNGWILQRSSFGRGVRLYETFRAGADVNIRCAIDAATKADK